MNKCLECGSVFEKPHYHKEPHGEVLLVCPECCGAYEQAKPCCCCEELFHSEDDFYRGHCYSCARDSYCDELGFLYIETPENIGRNQNDFNGSRNRGNLEADFYLSYLYGVWVEEQADQSELLDILRHHFKAQWLIHSKIFSYIYTTSQNLQSKQLRSYCLDDMLGWIDFLVEFKSTARIGLGGGRHANL